MPDKSKKVASPSDETLLAARRQAYHRLNSHFAACDDRQLLALLGENQNHPNQNDNQVIRVGHNKVFVKRVPVTQLEYDHPHSTKNLYRLPTYYNYGVNSAGFVIWREILAHIKTTNWVLEGSIPHFPLLYHYRIVPYTGRISTKPPGWFEDYIKYWNNNQRVAALTRDRLNPPYEALLFLEYIPHALHHWIPRHLDKVDFVLRQGGRTLAFMRRQGIIHFDSHWLNVLTDGERIYFTDFGLALDRASPLNARERDFFDRHRDYDSALFLNGLGYYAMNQCLNLPAARRARFNRAVGLADDADRSDVFQHLLAHVEEVCADGAIKLPAPYAEALARYRAVILAYHRFVVHLTRNRRKNTLFDHRGFKRLLKGAGFP